MPVCLCRNCGEPNIFLDGPLPEKVKCCSCGNMFRTEGTASGQGGTDLPPSPEQIARQRAAWDRQWAQDQAAMKDLKQFIGQQSADEKGSVVGFVLYMITVVIAFFVFRSAGWSYVLSGLQALFWPFVFLYHVLFD